MAASEEQNRLNTEHTQDSELEQYGVWVKAGPEDVDESEAEDEAFTLTDLGEDELDEAELDLLGLHSLEEEFGTPAADEDEDELDELLTIEEDDITIDIDDQNADEGEPAALDLEDLEPLTDDSTGPEPPAAVAEPELGGSQAIADDEDGGIDIEDELPGSLDDLTLDLDSLDVDSFAEPATDTPTSEAPDDEKADDLEELDLDLDLDASILNLDEEDLNLEEDELDLESLGLDDEETEIAELDLSSLPDDDEFGSGSTDEIEQPAEDELPELETDDDLILGDTLEESFDDVGAVEDQMLSEPTAPSADDQSRTLLESIERELGSIRTELSDLKRELSQLRDEPGRVIETAAESDEEAAGGFFEADDEDEDETIALTGAELDNIMNTAEFTEETGRPTDFDELLKEQPVEVDSDAVQEITLEEAPEESGTIDLDLGGEPEKRQGIASDAQDPLFSGSDDDVEALANMDIDAELSDIEELADDAPSPPDASDLETETEIETETDLDLIFDVEPLDLEEDTEEPETPTPRVEEETTPVSAPSATAESDSDAPIPENLKGELRSVLNYMDKL
ncbi:MAG: hypothetical protein ACOC2N_04690, partial [Spirochaetota bacterium]